MWWSPASRRCPALPNCRMLTLHLGCRRMGGSKYPLIFSLLSYVQPPFYFPCSQSPGVRQMSGCSNILLRFLLADIFTLSLFPRTIKRTTCRYPWPLALIVKAFLITISRQITSNLKIQMAIISFVLLDITALCHASRLFFFFLSLLLHLSLMSYVLFSKVRHKRGAPCRDIALYPPAGMFAAFRSLSLFP